MGLLDAGRRATAVVAVLVVAATSATSGTSAAEVADALASGAPAVNPDDTLTYLPYGLLHTVRPPAEVDGFLADLDAYDIGQALHQTPRLRFSGRLVLPSHDERMLGRWSRRAEAYNAEHRTRIAVTAVINAQTKGAGNGIDMDDPATRARMVKSVERLLDTGVHGIHLDLEPYPTVPGYLALLEEIGAAFDRRGFDGRLSVAAPGQRWKWTSAQVHAVSELVDQMNPLLYDSGRRKDIEDFDRWTRRSLAYYSEHAVASARIVPVLPAYSANPWHRPEVENIATSTAALGAALEEGSRVNGAGIWWWWGFFYDEDGAYDGEADREAWSTRTVELPFTR